MSTVRMDASVAPSLGVLEHDRPLAGVGNASSMYLVSCVFKIISSKAGWHFTIVSQLRFLALAAQVIFESWLELLLMVGQKLNRERSLLVCVMARSCV